MAGAARVLMRPLRARILEELAEPASAAGVARRLSIARQKVTYHLNELEKEGLVELVEERRSGNCIERIVRATSRAYLVTAEALGAIAEGSNAKRDRFSAAYLVAVAAQAAGAVASMQVMADEQKKRLATLTLQSEVRFASAESRAAFADELAREVARLIAKYHDESAPRGRVHRLATLVYPSPPTSREERERSP